MNLLVLFIREYCFDLYERLKELGEYLKKTYAKNLLNEAVEVRTTEGDVYERYIRWEKPVQINRIVLQEDITKSMSVRS